MTSASCYSTTLLTKAASFFVFSAWLLPAIPFNTAYSFATEDATGDAVTLPIEVTTLAFEAFTVLPVAFVQEDQFLDTMANTLKNSRSSMRY
jgi:hypothetical protein